MSRCAITVLSAMLAGLLTGGCRNDVEKGIDAANQLFFEQRYARAEALYRRTLKRLDDRDGGKAQPSPSLLAVLDRLGGINTLYLHNYEQALSDYARLVQEFPDAEEAFNGQLTIADIYQNRLGDMTQAAAEYQKLIKRYASRPETAKYQMQLIELLFGMKNYEQAEKEAEQLIHLWPNAAEVPKAYFDIANVAYVTGQLDTALAEYEKLLAKYPNDAVAPLVQFEMASCYQEKGETAKALELLYATLKTHPHPQIVQHKIARIKGRQNRTAPSRSIIEQPHAQAGRAASKPAHAPAEDDSGEDSPSVPESNE